MNRLFNYYEKQNRNLFSCCSLNILLALLLSLTNTSFAQNTSYSVAFENADLSEVIVTLEQEYDLLFSYEQNQLTAQTITLRFTTTDVDELLERIFRTTRLQYERVDERYILLSPRPAEITTPALQSFCGRVSDSLSLDPLAYANVYLLGTSQGVTSGTDGRFCLRAAPRPTDTLIISYVGYREYRVAIVDFQKAATHEIQLAYYDFGQEFVIVTDYLSDGVQLADGGFATEITPRQLRTLPGQVEPDILQSVQNLPGISSPDGALANLHIRGSTPDQNLILWEDIPVYHSAHYFGTISAFNPYAIDKIRVYRGGFGAEYGGRIAGVIDLKTDPQTGGNRLGVGTNLLTVFLDGQLELPKKSGALSVSLRRSITELGYAPFFRQLRFRNQQNLLRGSSSPSQLPSGLSVTDTFRFFDAQLKYALDISKRDRLEVAYLHADNSYGNLLSDDLRGRDHRDDLQLRNRGWNASWRRQWSPEWKTTLSAISADYDYDYQFFIDFRNPSTPDGFGTRNNDIAERQLKLTSNYRLPTQAEFNLGYQLTDYTIGYFITEEEQEVNLANQAGGSASLLHTIYATYRTAAHKKTGFQLGLRTNYYDNIDALYWEPRAQFWHQLTPELRLQLAAGKYYQFLSQLNEFKGANIGISSPIWILADRPSAVLNATHWQGGLLYESGTWLVDVQAYTKESEGLNGLAIGFLPQPSHGFDLGRSQVRGVDLLIKKRWGQFSSWFSYSLSQVTYEFPTFFDPEFAAPFDQRHRLRWAGSIRRGRWEYSLSWKIGSGLPYSLLEKFELTSPQMSGGQVFTRPIYDAYNAEQLAPQHQLNAAVMYTLNTKKPAHWNGIIGISFLNIYDQTNTYQREYFIDNRPNLPRQIDFEDSIQMGFTPNFVVRVEWK